jgi:energy coupling factor transporter S component ThiW
MKTASVKKLALAGILCAVAVAGSLLSFPVFGSKCAPVQHMVNVLCAVFLGPWYGLAAAFVASLLRNLLGWGSLLAFPGSMCGALLCGLAYRMTKNLPATLAAEVLGTGVLGGLAAYPVAKELMGLTPETYTVYILPFLISTAAGSILTGILVFALQKNGALKSMQSALER